MLNVCQMQDFVCNFNDILLFESICYSIITVVLPGVTDLTKEVDKLV